jgi:hypothetical protein
VLEILDRLQEDYVLDEDDEDYQEARKVSRQRDMLIGGSLTASEKQEWYSYLATRAAR